jgi:hypothetical protein
MRVAPFEPMRIAQKLVVNSDPERHVVEASESFEMLCQF